MNKKLMIGAAVAVGLWFLLRKPNEANAAEVDDEKPPEGGGEPVTDSGGPTSGTGIVGGGKMLPIPTEYKPSGADSYEENKDNYVASIVGSLGTPEVNPGLLAVGESPTNPTTIPAPGQWYKVKKGDTSYGIIRKAGLPGNKWRVMRDHINNDWIPKQYPDGRYFAFANGEQTLALFPWYDAPYYQSKIHYSGGHGYPVVYIPTESEALA